jgi:hypothetical protein
MLIPSILVISVSAENPPIGHKYASFHISLMMACRDGLNILRQYAERIR